MRARPTLKGEPGDSTRTARRISDVIPRSLGTRLALTYTGLALCIMAGLGLSLAWTIQGFFLAQVQSDLLQETMVAGDVMAPFLTDKDDSVALNAAADRLSEGLGARVTVVNAAGTVLVDSDRDAENMENHLGRSEIEQAFRDGIGTSLRMSSTAGAPYFYAARSIADGNAVIRLGIPVVDIDELVRGIRRQVFTAAVIAAVLMTGAGWFVARRIRDTLDDIRGQVAAIAAGQLHASVEPAATRELGDLGRAFNTMTTQLRGTVTELERMRVRLEETLANLSDGVIITDERGHVVLANQSALTMLAVRGPVIGEPVVEVARDHELADMVRQALTTEDGADERVIRHGLSGRILQAAARRLDVASERIGVIVLRDVTELRRLEGMRREFVANVSHELRTPLTSIRALVETLEAGALHDSSVSADFLARIISEVDRLAQIVDELLDLARLETGRVRLALERIEPEAMINNAVRRIAPQIERAGLTVEIEVTPGTPAIVGDRARVDQVLLNLVHNAVKFTPPGGRITVHAASVQDVVEIQVRDTGVGVNTEELPRLFERFYKADRARRSEGTGLGLAIAKHIVQAHGGTIWAEQNRGGGTVFVFQLPVAGPLVDEGGGAGDDSVARGA
jgi:two-component system, OmpR family, phosphate regulon sensor histidine kinase PhoR